MARAFPVSPVYVDGRKSYLHHISAGCMQKPRPLKRVLQLRPALTFATTLQSARYRASKSSKVMRRLWVPKVRISSIIFVVKTTRESSIAPFDALDDMPRRCCAQTQQARLPSWPPSRCPASAQKKRIRVRPQED